MPECESGYLDIELDVRGGLRGRMKFGYFALVAASILPDLFFGWVEQQQVLDSDMRDERNRERVS